MVRELNVKERDLLQRIVEKPELQTFFFRRAKGLHWFDPLVSHRLLVPEHNPQPTPARDEGYINVPPWPATDYLVNTSDEIRLPENEEHAIKYIDFIRETTHDAKNRGFSNYITWWQLAKVMRKIPVHLIMPQDLEIVDYWLDDPYEKGFIVEEIGEKWLPDLLKETNDHSHRIALGLMNLLFDIKFVNKQLLSSTRQEPILRYDSWHAKKLIDSVGRPSGERIGLDAVKIFESKLMLIFHELDNDNWSSIWRSAIEDHEQNRSHDDVESVLLSAYRDCLSGLVGKDVTLAQSYIKAIFGQEYQTLKRVAILIINHHFDHLQALTGELLKPEYFTSNYRHEVWHFLKCRYHELSPEQQKAVIEIIEGIELLDDDGIVEEVPTAYKRSVWLSSIRDLDVQAAELYQNYRKITQADPEHPDFSSYMSVGFVSQESPIPLEELLSLDIIRLKDRIDSYKDPKRPLEPRLEGLVKAFKSVIKAKASEFYLHLNEFVTSDLAFVDSIVEAYSELWTEKRQLPWNAIWQTLFEFCEKLFALDCFWADDADKEQTLYTAYRGSVVSSICRMVEEGTKSDEHAFDPNLMPKAKEILLTILEKQRGEEFSESSDSVTVAINSPRGRCIEALINHSLRACRLADKATNNHAAAWQEYQHIYDSELQRKDNNEYEFVTLVTLYLPNFLYMSRDWVLSNLPNIFDPAHYLKWLCSMQGYAHVSVVHREIYDHLKQNGSIVKALDDPNLKERIQRRFVQNICVAYLHNFERLDDPKSLISILFSRYSYDEMHQLIWFVWALRERDKTVLLPKVYELWPKILGLIDFDTKEGRKLASQLCHWASLVDDVDSTSEEWLLMIAPYAQEDHNSYEFLQSLAKISGKQPLLSHRIWLKMLESYSYDYPEEAIKTIFANLIGLGFDGKHKAQEVVDAYLRYGIERPRMWLREVVESAEQESE